MLAIASLARNESLAQNKSLAQNESAETRCLSVNPLASHYSVPYVYGNLPAA